MTMSAWIGCGVSITCDESLGCYQGTIIEADGSTITLTRAFRNGFPYPKPQVTLKASDIKDIQIIDQNPDGKKDEKKHSTVEVTKTAKKFPKSSTQNVQQQSQQMQIQNQQQTEQHSSSGGNSYEGVPSTSQSLPNNSVLFMPQPGKFQNNNYNNTNNSAASSSNNHYGNSNGHYNQKQNYGHMNGYHSNNNSKSKPIDIQGRNNRMNNGGGMNSGSTPNKKDRQRRRNEACFGTPNDDLIMGQDFDFEKNLALFDKRALWEELNQAQKPDVVGGGADPLRRHASQQKYRHDENILTSQPATYTIITVPPEGKGATEYVTDDGLVIPSVTRELRGRIMAGCAKAGLGGGEVFGRAGAEVTLQLLGGTRRLHPRNNHQVPTVAFLVGPHRQGAVGVTCARHLASHGVATVVLVAGPDVQGTLRQYLNVYQMTGNKLTTNILDLPSSVDLIIVALCEDSDQPTSYPHVAEWISQSRAPVLALDPPAVGTPGVTTKYSLIPILPLSHCEENGKLYLCNLAIPKKIFNDAGVQYSSPFGSKFVIPLHPNDSS